MKSRSHKKNRGRWQRRASLFGRCLVGTALATGLVSVRAAEAAKEEKEEAPTPEEMFEGGSEAYPNWVEFSAGGLFTSGNKAQAESRQQMKEGAFGGIEDLHYQANVGTNKTTLTLDGRALFDLEDYQLALELRRENLGYVRFNYEQFRTWYNGNGGYYRPGDIWYPLPGSDEALGLDRGLFSFEAGLRLENTPEVTFKYTHRFRDGQKGSTSWGLSHPGLGAVTRGLNASFYDIDETADIFEFDVTHTIKKTDVGVGLRYETGEIDNSRNMLQWPGEPTERHLTDRSGTEYDFFSAHAFSETWIKPKLFLSSGFLFSTMDSDYSGSRIYGDDFNVGYTPNALNALGYYDLSGGSRANEYAMNINLMGLPQKGLSIAPSLRVQKRDWDADSAGFQTSDTAAPLFSTSNSDGDALDVTERLDVNYTRLTNWVFYARGEWTQGSGNLRENGGMEQIAPVTRETEDERFFQKYSIGTRWYPARKVTLDLGAYYKFNQYDYDHLVDSTPTGYPAYLVMQDFETYDGNVRLSLRPHTRLTLVTRYEYQISTVNTAPDAASGLSGTETSELTSHIVGQNISWTPWSRLYLQAGINYVFSETATPASDYTQAILDAQNNYWTVNFNAGFVLDDRTDLNLGYFYYRADDYEDNSAVGLPLGSGAEEHGITAMISRRINKNIRLNLKYGYFHYADELYGGNNDSEAHFVSAGLQYRF
jgi:hypothetical protein